MKVTITIEAGSKTIGEALENIASYFDGSEFEGVDRSAKPIRELIFAEGDLGDNPIGTMTVEKSKRSR